MERVKHFNPGRWPLAANRVQGVLVDRVCRIKRRPNPRGVEDCKFEEFPEPRHKEHDLGCDEQDHAIAQADLDNRGVITAAALLDHFAPPASHHVDDAGKADQHEPRCTLWKAKQALHIGHCANGEHDHRQ